MYQPYPAEEDLMVFMAKPPFEEFRCKHLKRGSLYTVISQGEYSLNTFSEEGTLHEFPYKGRMVVCTMQFSGDGTSSKYAGPITIYYGDDGKFWLRPTFEFDDGRFERIN